MARVFYETDRVFDVMYKEHASADDKSLKTSLGRSKYAELAWKYGSE